MNKSLAIIALSVSAALLLAANFLVTPEPLSAAEVVQNRDYQLVTAQVVGGGDALYVLDNATGTLAVFSFDPSRREIVPRVVRPITEFFPAGR